MRKTINSLCAIPSEDLANVTGGAPVAKALSQAQQMLKHGGVVKNGIWSATPKGPGIAVSTIPGVLAF